jgi:hypothetical protein
MTNERNSVCSKVIKMFLVNEKRICKLSIGAQTE